MTAGMPTHTRPAGRGAPMRRRAAAAMMRFGLHRAGRGGNSVGRRLARQTRTGNKTELMSASSPDTGSIDFAALLCSRLCHDLLSPVGALNNGLELMADETDPEMRQRCVDLLTDSARTSANKLKFFRLAFGSAGGFGDMVPTNEARAAIEGMFSGAGRVKLGWLIAEDQLPKRATKILLNLALIAGDALVRGGQLDIGAERRGDLVEIVVRAEGPKLVLDPELRAALAGSVGAEGLSARTAAAWMTRSLITAAGGEVMLSPPGEAMLLFGASLPA
jgi:histidine phosphotransferase ChpT